MRLLGLLCMVACSPSGPADPQPEAPTRIDHPTTPSAPAPPSTRECVVQRYKFRSEVGGAYFAKAHFAHQANAVAMAAATHPACRSGAWYLTVARLLDLHAKLELQFDSPEAALAAALQQPDEVEVLERVAQVSALGRDITLPPDACERARAVADLDAISKHDADGTRYVCARVEIATNQGAAAVATLDRIKDKRRYPDFELALAQAMKLAGDRAGAIRHARAAIVNAKQFGRETTAQDRDAIIRLAEALGRQP